LRESGINLDGQCGRFYRCADGAVVFSALPRPPPLPSTVFLISMRFCASEFSTQLVQRSGSDRVGELALDLTIAYSKTRNFECLRVPSSPDPGPVICWPGWTWLPSRSPGSGSHSCVAHTLKYCKWGYLHRLETSLTPPLQALYYPWWLHQALGRKFPTLGLVRPCDLFYAVQVHFLRLVGEINFCIPLH